MRRSVLFSFGLSAATLLASEMASAADVPIVYARCARTTAELDVTGTVVVGGVSKMATRHMRGLDVYDILPDVVHFYGGFSAPCDLVRQDPDGTETVLHDCSSTSTAMAACAAMDPAVSFDGKTIAYAVFNGSLTTMSENVNARVIDPAAENTTDNFKTVYPNQFLDSTDAQIWLVDVATGKTTALPHIAGTFDSGPAWLPDGRIAFTSTRDGAHSTLVHGTTSSDISAQIWTMDPDGRNLAMASHHGLGREEHPFVLADGRVAYSSWQIFGGLPFRYGNGSVGGFTTLHNMFNIYTQNPDGSHPFAFYGQHSGDHSVTTSIGFDHQAGHFLTQTTDGRVYFVDYYRANNNGLGGIVGVMPEPEGQEGLAPDPMKPIGDLFAPHDAISASKWARNGDSMAKSMPAPQMKVPTYADSLPFVGKLGHPAALPANGLMVTWGKGACSTVAGTEVFTALGLPVPPGASGSGQGTAMNVITSLNMDTPGCDGGLYRMTKLPSDHPNDLELIVDKKEWHEIQARAIVPYSAIHAVDKPKIIPRSELNPPTSTLPQATPFGLLGAASILDRETHPVGGIHFAGEHQFQLQGTDTIDYTDDALCGVRILGVQPNRGKDINVIVKDMHDLAGERMLILGEFPVRNTDASGNPIMDPSGKPDTSFLVRFPADTPYLMQGIDCDGRTLNTDQTWQSLKPGEMKTCGGCHVHSRPSAIVFAQSVAVRPEYQAYRLGEGQVPLLVGQSGGKVATKNVPGYGMQIEFERDIMPIFAARCNSCHGGATPAASLALDRPGLANVASGNPSSWYCLVDDRDQSCIPQAARFVTNAGSMGSTRFRRPQVTRYIRAFNALGSLLYWKAAGKRTDGRTDDTFTSASAPEDIDLDFGAAHPTEITPDELGILSRWIDIGAPGGGAAELQDTTKPTLTLSAVVEGNGVTKLLVGTVDVPSGIDTKTLEVCVVDAMGGCGPNLAPEAAPHDVIEIALPNAFTEANTEVRARVLDLAGNERIVQRTIGWFLNAPPPMGTGGAGGAGGANGAGGMGNGGGPGGTDGGGTGCGCSVPGESSPYVPTGIILALAFGAGRMRRFGRRNG